MHTKQTKQANNAKQKHTTAKTNILTHNEQTINTRINKTHTTTYTQIITKHTPITNKTNIQNKTTTTNNNTHTEHTIDKQ